jgi:uncharacterized protein with HEPN domain
VPSSNPVQRFQDILDNIARIEQFTASLSLEKFISDEEKLYAVQHALLIISEAAAKLGDMAPELCPEIDWRDVRGLGNRLRHEYHRIDAARLWLMLQRDLPVLKAASVAAMHKLQGSGTS